MAQADPFRSSLESHAALAPRLAQDAVDEADLLPTILSEVRAFCAEHVDGARIDHDGRLGSDLLGEVAARGWFGLTVPARFGGAGLSLAAATRVVSELAAHNGSLGTCVGLHSGLALHALLHLGDPGVQERYLAGRRAGQAHRRLRGHGARGGLGHLGGAHHAERGRRQAAGSTARSAT